MPYQFEDLFGSVIHTNLTGGDPDLFHVLENKVIGDIVIYGLIWNVSMIMRQLGLEFREENANHVRLVQRLLHDIQVLGRIKDEERSTP